MALIGYKFESREDIGPFVEQAPADIGALIDSLDAEEEAKDGELCSFKWALQVSRRFSPAWVALGFAEKDDEDRYFNSALVVNHELRICHIVRKVLLWFDDKKWATLESTVSGVEYNFQHRDLFFPRLQRQVRCGIAICMDIQYKDLDMSLKDSKKLAHYQTENETQMLIWLTAWTGVDPKRVQEGDFSETQLTAKWNSHWVDDLEPVTRSGEQSANPFYFVACNRIGVEKTGMFIGSSCIVKIRPEVAHLASPASALTEQIVEATCQF